MNTDVQVSEPPPGKRWLLVAAILLEAGWIALLAVLAFMR